MNDQLSLAYTCNLLALFRSLLPLRILARHEGFQNSKSVLKRLQPDLQLLLDPGLVRAQLRVEVLPVWCSVHGKSEDGLDHEAVMWLQCVAVGACETL